jgi:deoxyribodipyrimidine photolyase-related protein
MVMFADGGVVGSKPYASTGKYIQKMSDYCASCQYDPARRTGDDACPFTTFYWDFLMRHRSQLESIPRMRMMYRNVDRIKSDEAAVIAARATELRRTWGIT